MRRCVHCKAEKLRPTTVRDTITVGGHTFTADLPALRCEQCDTSFIDGPAGERFELEVARRLAAAGEASGEVARYLRKSLALNGSQLADLLGVTLETVSRWENGKLPVERRAMALLGSMVLEQSEGRRTTREALEALRSPRPLNLEVEVLTGPS